MIPCYSLFLEVEVPDPRLNFFVLGRDELDNTEKLLAPNLINYPGLEPEPPKDYRIEIVKTDEIDWYESIDYGYMYTWNLRLTNGSDTPLYVQVIDDNVEFPFRAQLLPFGSFDFVVHKLNGEGTKKVIEAVAYDSMEGSDVVARTFWSETPPQAPNSGSTTVRLVGETDWTRTDENYGYVYEYELEISNVDTNGVYVDIEDPDYKEPGDDEFNPPFTNETQVKDLYVGPQSVETVFLQSIKGDDKKKQASFKAYDKPSTDPSRILQATYNWSKTPPTSPNPTWDWTYTLRSGSGQWAFESGEWRCRYEFDLVNNGPDTVWLDFYDGSTFDETESPTANGSGIRFFGITLYDETPKTLEVQVRTYANGEKVWNVPTYITLDPGPIPGGATRDACVPAGKNTLILDESCIESDVDLLEGYGAAKPGYAWVDLITDTTEIEIERGFDTRQGVVGTPIAGVLSANIIDPYLDALNTQKVAIGQRCRLRAGGEIVFTGVVNVLRSEYNAVDVPTLYLESVDALGLLNAQMVSERPQELYTSRMRTAVERVNLPNIIEPSTTMLNPTEDPMSALDLLIETQDSEGSICWLDRFGVFYSTNRYWKTNLSSLKNSRFYEGASFTFSNNPVPSQGINIDGVLDEVCLSEYVQSADTREVINGITFYNYVEEDDTDFEGKPIKTIVRDTYTFSSGNSQRLYGDAGVRLTTYLDPSELPAYADYIFANYDTPYEKVERLQFPLDKWKDLSVPRTTALDIGDAVDVRIEDPFSGQILNRAEQRITRIRHSITPTEWLCELDLL